MTDGKLTDVSSIGPVPRQEILDMLDNLKERVETEELRGFAAYTLRNGDTGNSVIANEWPILMLGAIEAMKRDIEDAFIDLRLHKPGEYY